MRVSFKLSILLPFFIACLLFVSCKDSRGPAGPAGPNGSVLAVFQQWASPSSYYFGESDTYISSGSPDSNYGGGVSAPAGPYSGFGTRRILIKFDISGDMPPGVIVTGASLELYCTYADTGNGNTLTAYRVTQPWIETGATWNSDGTNPWTGGAYDIPAGTPEFCTKAAENSYVNFTIDPGIVQSWVDDPAGNNGLLIIASSEDTSTYNTVSFYTKENGTV
jgi:hypothetical protein